MKILLHKCKGHVNRKVIQRTCKGGHKEILKLILDTSKQNVKDEESSHGFDNLEHELQNWLSNENEYAKSAMENKNKGSKEYCLGQFLNGIKSKGTSY